MWFKGGFLPESGLQAVPIWAKGLPDQYSSGAVEVGVQGMQLYAKLFADHKHRNS